MEKDPDFSQVGRDAGMAGKPSAHQFSTSFHSWINAKNEVITIDLWKDLVAFVVLTRWVSLHQDAREETNV